MALRDIENRVVMAQSLTPAARTATTNGTTIDTQGYGSAVAIILFGTWTDGTHTPSLQHSSDGSTWVTCDTTNLNGSFTAVSSAGGNGTVQKIGYMGGLRYLRVVMTVAGATVGAVAAGEILLSHPAQQPV